MVGRQRTAWELVYECAGIIGVTPDSWTLRELLLARDARETSEWWHTACLQSLLANVNRPPHKPAYSPYDFHPYATKPKREISIDELERLISGK
jgi:hypothetical protein